MNPGTMRLHRSWRSFRPGIAALAITVLVTSLLGVGLARAADTRGPRLVRDQGQMVPFASTGAALRRAPYLTDVSATTATVNLATDTSTPAPVVAWDVASVGCAAPSHLATAALVTSFAGTLSGTTDYQFNAPLAGLAANTSYCYRVSQAGQDVYVYCDNDMKVRAPYDAMGLMERLGVHPSRG